MKAGRLILASLAAAAVLWGIVSWPLPRHLLTGIASSAHNIERGQVRRMIPGDPLQLLYHYDLFADMLAGHTPWFRDVYQFNTGDDESRRRFSMYFAPYSWVHAAGAALGGRALGYNLAAFFSFWAGILFAWMLVRRFGCGPAAAAAGVLAATLLPFRLATLMGGSPTGLAMAWMPVLALGIDLAVRDGRAAGGVLAGLAFLGLSWVDPHSLIFSAPLAVFAVLFSLAAEPCFLWRRLRSYVRPLAALLPALALALVAVLFMLVRTRHIPESVVAGGRPLTDLKLYSPHLDSFLSWQRQYGSVSVYIGWAVPALIAAGLGALAWRWWRYRLPLPRRLVLLGLLLAAILAVLILALGTNVPFLECRVQSALRRLVPPLAMVRQPAKVFAILPPLLALAVALAFAAVADLQLRPLLRRIGGGLITLALAADLAGRIRATVCRLDTDQGAYRAVAEDAAHAGLQPRALVVPLWPGDSAWSSLYQHYASLFRIRMLNGYSPSANRAYAETIIPRHRPANLGFFSAEQLADLGRMGVRYVLLHEDAYPEKVSPFPVGIALGRMLADPRLTLLRRDGSVWAFRIDSDAVAPGADEWPPAGYFPARRWQAEREGVDGVLVKDAAAARGEYLRLTQGQGRLKLRVSQTAWVPGLAWWLRAKGDGALAVRHTVESVEKGQAELPVGGTDWTWIRVPAPVFAAPAELRAEASAARGAVDVDLVLFTAGAWRPDLKTGESVRLPAAQFFHAGCRGERAGSVFLRMDRDPAGVIFYGPHLPLEPGTYRVGLAFRTAAPPGEEVARLGVRNPDRDGEWASVTAGAEAAVEFHQPQNLPLLVEVLFLRQADLELEEIRIERLR